MAAGSGGAGESKVGGGDEGRGSQWHGELRICGERKPQLWRQRAAEQAIDFPGKGHS